jgi:hypothetical protein
MLSALMQLLTKRHRVSFLFMPELERVRGDATKVAELFSKYDAVFLEKTHNTVEVPQSVRDRVVAYPVVFFYGLHPDLVYVWLDGKPVQGPLGDYHSSLALYGFLHGMSVEQTVSLFNPAVYEALGFFGLYEESSEHYLGLGRADGFDMRPHLVRWARRGAFMYSVNHPRAFVLEDLATELLARVDPGARREPAPGEVSELIPDMLASGPVFPVYPEIGLRLGIRGTYAFKPAAGHRVLTLAEFVAESHEAYRRMSGTPSCPRLDDPRYGRLTALA